VALFFASIADERPIFKAPKQCAFRR
jgi:hypothetical protein